MNTFKLFFKEVYPCTVESAIELPIGVSFIYHYPYMISGIYVNEDMAEIDIDSAKNLVGYIERRIIKFMQLNHLSDWSDNSDVD